MNRKKITVAYGLAVLTSPAFAMTSGIEHNKKSIISEHYGFTDALLEPKGCACFGECGCKDSPVCPYEDPMCGAPHEGPCKGCYDDHNLG